MDTPEQAAIKKMNAARAEQGGTCDQHGEGNPFSGCGDPGEYMGHKSASSSGQGGKEDSKGVGK